MRFEKYWDKAVRVIKLKALQTETFQSYQPIYVAMFCFFQVYAGIFESIAIIISIFTVTRYGIQKNIFYNILIAGICLMYIAIFPNAEWTLVVFLAMLGMY